MTVFSVNSNALPMTNRANTGQIPSVPATSKPGSAPVVGTKPVDITQPQQVMGLVPLFQCCGDQPYAILHWLNENTSQVVSFNIKINGVIVGSFSSTGTDTPSMVQAEVLSALPAGFTCMVTRVIGTGNTTWYATIYAPVSAISTYSGATCQLLVISGTGIFGATNFISVQNSAQCDCRRSGYGADYVKDDTQWTIPAIASSTKNDPYLNDKSSWLLQYPAAYNAITLGDFHLQSYDGAHWNNIATLNTTAFGTPYSNTWSPTGGACTNFNYCGYQLEWRRVLITFGEGTYRFLVGGAQTDRYPYCLASPPFCLKEYSCDTADSTVRFEANYKGGNMGSVTKQGFAWSLCCQYGENGKNVSSGITWYDSIRFYGFFGHTTFDLQRDQIKYQSGVINKVRDEAIKKFTLRIGGGGSTRNAPQWLLDRFAAYALMSDKLLVSDYNMNNPDYNLNRFWVVADSGFEPKYYNASRYMKVLSTAFKEGTQYIFRDRCC